MKLSEKLIQCIDHNAKQSEYYYDAKFLEDQVDALQKLDLLNKDFGAGKIAFLEKRIKQLESDLTWHRLRL